jgi:hypothetical protein
MRTIFLKSLVAVILLSLSATFALAATDHICMDHCADRGYSYKHCLSSCTYTTEYERGLVREQYLKNKMIEQDIAERKHREEERREALREEKMQREEEKRRIGQEKEQMEYERNKYNQGN